MGVEEDKAGSGSGDGRGFAGRFAIAFAAAFLLLAAPLAHLLRQTDYPILSAEAGIALAALAGGAALFALLHAALRRPLARAALEGLFAAFLLDLAFSAGYWAAAGGVAVFALAASKRRSAAPAGAMMGGVMLATTLVGLGGGLDWWVEERAQAAPTPASTGRPALLHVILDEHIGIAGLPGDHPGSAALAAELRGFFEARGFRLYERAYSEHLHTVNAIPHILNFGERLGENHDKEGVRVGRTAWLDSLARRGFRLHIYQSDFADLCSGVQAAECHTYAYRAMRPVRRLPYDEAERARMILDRLLGQSASVRWLDNQVRLRQFLGGGRPPALEVGERSRTSSIVGFFAFDRLIEDLGRARPGDAFVAHLLVPHFPYVVDRRCRFLPRERWDARLSPQRRRQRLDGYFEQVRCTMRKLGAALDALAASPAGREAIVVVHGDHGSRIVRRDPDASAAGSPSDADLVAGFSTLFAIRAPGIAPGREQAPAPAAWLLRDFEASGFRAAPSPAVENPTVSLDDSEWNPQRRVPFAPAW